MSIPILFLYSILQSFKNSNFHRHYNLHITKTRAGKVSGVGYRDASLAKLFREQHLPLDRSDYNEGNSVQALWLFDLTDTLNCAHFTIQFHAQTAYKKI